MPTASTAQILGNNEPLEPYTQNLYVRRVPSGEFVQVNRHLLRDLVREACGKTYSEVSAFVENESFPLVVKTNRALRFGWCEDMQNNERSTGPCHFAH